MRESFENSARGRDNEFQSPRGKEEGCGEYIGRQQEDGRFSWEGACFGAGTPLRVPGGSKNIEEIRVGDLVLSRDENDPIGEIIPKRVEELFVRESLIWELHVGGQVIRTSPEHPFWVEGKGWLAINRMVAGDRLISEDGTSVVVEKLVDTSERQTVYNFRVEDYHTYFVGCDGWGWAVWAHNAYSTKVQDRSGPVYVVPHGFNTYEEYHNFAKTFQHKIQIHDPDAKGYMQGSAVTGVIFEPPHPAFDVGRISDFDIAIESPKLVAFAEKNGIKVTDAGHGLGKNTQPINATELFKTMGLEDIQIILTEMAVRKVNFMIFEKTIGIFSKSTLMPITTQTVIQQ